MARVVASQVPRITPVATSKPERMKRQGSDLEVRHVDVGIIDEEEEVGLPTPGARLRAGSVLVPRGATMRWRPSGLLAPGRPSPRPIRCRRGGRLAACTGRSFGAARSRKPPFESCLMPSHRVHMRLGSIFVRGGVELHRSCPPPPRGTNMSASSRRPPRRRRRPPSRHLEGQQRDSAAPDASAAGNSRSSS